MFETFTKAARKVIFTCALEEARRSGHNRIGTEQILLGLISEGTGKGARALAILGVNLDQCRTEVERIIGRGSGIIAREIPFTPRAKRLLELAKEEAQKLGHNYIGTEHLLLGLIREENGVALQVLQALGVDLDTVKSVMLHLIKESPVSARTTTRYSWMTLLYSLILMLAVVFFIQWDIGWLSMRWTQVEVSWPPYWLTGCIVFIIVAPLVYAYYKNKS